MSAFLEVLRKVDLEPLTLQMPGRFGFTVRMGLHNIPSQRQAGTHSLYPYSSLIVHSLKIQCDIFMIGFPPASPSDATPSKNKRRAVINGSTALSLSHQSAVGAGVAPGTQ